MISPLRRNYASLKDCWNSGLKGHFVLSTAAFFILVVIFFLLGMFVPQVQENFMALTEAAMSSAVSWTEVLTVSFFSPTISPPAA